jgi:hypothetical protein
MSHIIFLLDYEVDFRLPGELCVECGYSCCKNVKSDNCTIIGSEEKYCERDGIQEGGCKAFPAYYDYDNQEFNISTACLHVWKKFFKTDEYKSNTFWNEKEGVWNVPLDYIKKLNVFPNEVFHAFDCLNSVIQQADSFRYEGKEVYLMVKKRDLPV